MRIYEIDDQDRTFAAASNVSLDIDIRFNDAKYILDILIKSKSAKRNAVYLPTVDEIEADFIWILNQKFSDDKSTKDLIEKTLSYLKEIQKLKALIDL